MPDYRRYRYVAPLQYGSVAIVTTGYVVELTKI